MAVDVETKTVQMSSCGDELRAIGGGQAAMRIEPKGHDLVGITASNPGPLTLEGTNSWVLGRDPAWLIDPGPDDKEHLAAVAREIEDRGGLGGIALTHDHHDHTGALRALRERFPEAPVAAARGSVERTLRDGDEFGPLQAVLTPGHAPDHLSFVVGEVGFTGDAVLGAGSVGISPYPGALAEYLEGLARLRARRLSLLCPGHGPLVCDPQAKLGEYIEHRLDRERRLAAALEAGARTVDEMLDSAWEDVPARLRMAAAWTLAAHLDKLEQEGRLPEGVQRPDLRGSVS